ncbi:MAG: AMP-binding protein, partial [candidate division WOR-3 bacterium]
LRHVITLFPLNEIDKERGVKLESYEHLRQDGAAALRREPALAVPYPAQPDDLFTICYTSGTTGEPKGAMLTHANVLSNVTTAIRRFSINEHDVLVSFLPLCHMFERTCGHYSVLLAGGAVAYAESVQTVAADVQKVRPTIMIVVPRVLEKVYTTVRERVLAGPWHKRQLMIATLKTYSQYGRLKAGRRRIGFWLGLKHWLLGRLVVSKLVKLGGGRLRLLVSGSAPLERRLARTIRNLGFNLLEGYGLTETSPVACAQVPGEEAVGTVGKPFDGVEIRIGANDEILIRGPNVMKGYFKKPVETAKAIDRDGWFHTGDQGRFDEKGNLVITGRLKEIIVNSYGKNLAPVPIEQALAGSKYVEQAIVHGDRRPFLVALIVPARLALEAFARESGIAFRDFRELLDHPRVLELYQSEINQTLVGFAQYEQVRKFRLIPEPFTVENGLLTPSLKVRRPNVLAAYRDELDKLYED